MNTSQAVISEKKTFDDTLVCTLMEGVDCRYIFWQQVNDAAA